MRAMQDKAATEPAVASSKAITRVASSLIVVKVGFMLSTSNVHAVAAIGLAVRSRYFLFLETVGTGPSFLGSSAVAMGEVAARSFSPTYDVG